MNSKKPLPPISDESFDGERYTTELITNKCLHKNIKHVGQELRCSCGVAYSGERLDELFKLLTKSST